MATKAKAEHKRYLKRREAAKKVAVNAGEKWEFVQTTFDLFSATVKKRTVTLEILSEEAPGMFLVLKNGKEKHLTSTEIGSNILRFKGKPAL